VDGVGRGLFARSRLGLGCAD